ncbi:MAG: UbiD family decarboxylase [Candidatus Bathyarchaeia archaeon]
MRRFLESVDRVTVRSAVSTELEAARILASERKPVLFERVKGYPGARIAGNLCVSRDLIAEALGASTGSLVAAIAEALEKPKGYALASDAAFLRNREENPNVKDILPLLMYYRERGRLYTSATVVFARDPESGRQNASFHRMMYLGGNRFAIRIVPRDLYRFWAVNKAAGSDTPIAVACGLHPAICLAAATSFPDLNELMLARAFHRFECLPVNGIDVPAEAEVVMTGRVLHDETADEGPFVDLTGTWDKVRKEPVVEVDTLYWRDDFIWQVILPGGREHRLLMGLPQEPRMLRIIRNTSPGVIAVALTEGGCNWLHAVVAIKKTVEGEGKNVGLAALAAHPSLKMVTVVDEDIDVTDPVSVEWAVATRLQPSRGIVVIPDAHGSSIDPSQGKSGLTGKWIVDATIPLEADRRDYARVTAG